MNLPLRLAAAAAALLPLAAAALRDPMQPPAPVAPAAAPAAPASAAPLPAVRHLVVADGRRWVVDGGRRRGVGDRLGDARIERIDDDAVVLRQGGALHRVPLHPGIVKQPAADPARR